MAQQPKEKTTVQGILGHNAKFERSMVSRDSQKYLEKYKALERWAKESNLFDRQNK